MKTLIVGAGGIVGQEMARNNPFGANSIFTRRESYGDYVPFSISSDEDIQQFFDWVNPDVIVNLSGVNEVDVVESAEGDFEDRIEYLNQIAPVKMASWAADNNAFFIQGSTQAVFSGNEAPYSPHSKTNPINKYGQQKANAEKDILYSFSESSLVARLTFVYGIRPDMTIGRANPIEKMMAGESQIQVDDRFFSPLWSVDAANILWKLAQERPTGIIHIGEPITISRYTMACHCAWDTYRNFNIKPVSHEFFEGIAARPKDSSWKPGASLYETPFSEGILNCYFEWRKKQ